MTQDDVHTIRVDDRITIRPYLPDDAEGLYPRLLAQRDQDLFWIQSIEGMRSVDDLVAEFAHVRRLLDQGRRLGGAIVMDGRIVGTCRISHIEPDVAQGSGDMGYWLFREARGGGVMTRCACALLDVAFGRLALSAVTITTAPENAPSNALARRLGFAFSHTVPGALHRGGRIYDARVYIMERSVFQLRTCCPS